MNNTIHIRGARQNNLRGFDLDLPKRQLIVVVGVSGSGKSSLVFDTIAAEAGRQINSTFSSYTQNFLPSHGRPDVELLQNLSAAVVIDQRRLTGGPRSTVATITDIGDWLRLLYSRASTPQIGHSQAFSFNDPAGMCPQCHGLGQEQAVDLARFLDMTRSLREGPFNHPDYRPGTVAWRKIADSRLFDIDVPLDQFTQREVDLLLNARPGEVGRAAEPAPHGSYEGVLVRFRRLQMSKDPSSLKGEARRAHEALVTLQPCTECHGTRLNDAARTAHIHGMTLPQAHAMQVADLASCMRKWELGALALMADEISRQLDGLTELGLGYLSLGRATSTLSGGEAQRVRMVRHLGSILNDMLYVFDEPTTGLHARDVDRLARMLVALRDQGNTVLVVEHDPAIMAVADQIVEIGPGAGSAGGGLVFQGSFAQLQQADTPTGRSLAQEMQVNRAPRTPTGTISIRHASSHNLSDVSVEIPTGVLTVVTGVAGSGKSSLIRGHLPQADPGAVLVDQSPIRASRRSTPASWMRSAGCSPRRRDNRPDCSRRTPTVDAGPAMVQVSQLSTLASPTPSPHPVRPVLVGASGQVLCGTPEMGFPSPTSSN